MTKTTDWNVWICVVVLIVYTSTLIIWKHKGRLCRNDYFTAVTIGQGMSPCPPNSVIFNNKCMTCDEGYKYDPETLTCVASILPLGKEYRPLKHPQKCPGTSIQVHGRCYEPCIPGFNIVNDECIASERTRPNVVETDLQCPHIAPYLHPNEMLCYNYSA